MPMRRRSDNTQTDFGLFSSTSQAISVRMSRASTGVTVEYYRNEDLFHGNVFAITLGMSLQLGADGFVKFGHFLGKRVSSATTKFMIQ